MNRPETEAEYTRYCASRRGRYYLDSPEFAERCALLDERLANGGISVTDAAVLVGLPINVFRHIFAIYLAMLVAHSAANAMAAPVSATLH